MKKVEEKLNRYVYSSAESGSDYEEASEATDDSFEPQVSRQMRAYAGGNV